MCFQHMPGVTIYTTFDRFILRNICHKLNCFAPNVAHFRATIMTVCCNWQSIPAYVLNLYLRGWAAFSCLLISKGAAKSKLVRIKQQPLIFKRIL